MISAEVQRTLVKSPPELWAELSDEDALARHLGKLGAIKITTTKPEQTVEWEAEAAHGMVELKPSGWGTKVTLSITREAPSAPVAEELTPAPEPEPVPEPEPRQGFFARLFKRRPKPEATTAEEPVAEPEPVTAVAEPEAAAAEPAATEEAITEQMTQLLNGVLDRLGAAHHRPFSRA